MENRLTTFNNVDFGEIRTIEKDGKILFCGKDIAECLGYSSPANAVTKYCRSVIILMTETNGRTRNIKFIPESDVYRLIFSSKLPAAEKFQNWIFEDVIPQIRKTGSYVHKPQTFLEAMEEVVRIEKERLALAEQNKELQEANYRLENENEVMTDLIKDAELMTVGQIAENHKMSAAQLNKFLHEQGIQYKQPNVKSWQLYQKVKEEATEKGTEYARTVLERNSGYKYAVLKWTPDGVKLIEKLLRRHGL